MKKILSKTYNICLDIINLKKLLVILSNTNLLDRVNYIKISEKHSTLKVVKCNKNNLEIYFIEDYNLYYIPQLKKFAKKTNINKLLKISPITITSNRSFYINL